MGFEELPPELLYLTLQFINNDCTTMSSLYAVNRRTNESVRQLVYQSVILCSTRTLGSFCDVITLLQPSYSTYVTQLSITPRLESWVNITDTSSVPYLPLSEELAVHFRHALGDLGNLKSLSLVVTPTMVGEILDNLIPPFNLETFNHSGEFSYPLLRFLKNQTSIINLGFAPMDEYNFEEWHLATASGTPILPNLTHLGGSLRFTAIMMPRCPISSITASSASRSTMEAFGGFIARSMVPITRIRIAEDSPGLAWVRLLLSLRAHHAAASNLQELTVNKIYKSGVNDAKRRSDDEFLLSACSTIFHFDALEKLEFNIIPFGQGTHHGPTPADACTWLAAHGMQDLSTWRVHNPSLRTVVVYGHVVPEAQPT